MRRNLLLMTMMLLSSVSIRAAEMKQLTLEDIKRFAISHNFALKAADAELRESQAQTTQLRSSYYPKVGIVAGPELRQEESQSNSEALSYVEGRWNLFRGSQDRIEVEISEMNEKISESSKRRMQFELELDVESLFYAHLLSSAKLKFYQASLELNDKHRQLLNRKRASGMASQADLMEFEIRESHLKSAMSALVQERDEARIGLVRLMGPDLGASFEPFGEVPHVHLRKTLPEFLSMINSTSEGVKIAALKNTTGSLSAKSARGGWFPTVDLETKYGRLPQDLATTSPAFQGTLLFKWELFSGFETNAKVSGAKARVDRLENEFRQKLLTAMTAAEVSFLKLKSTQERVHVEEGNEAKAKVYYNAILDEYRRGLKNGSDLKNAESLLLEARIRAADLNYSFIETKNKLERDVGIFIETEPHSPSRTK